MRLARVARQVLEGSRADGFVSSMTILRLHEVVKHLLPYAVTLNAFLADLEHTTVGRGR